MKYRYLKAGEMPRVGDEWMSMRDGKWRGITGFCGGGPAPSKVDGYYRRPINPIPTKPRKPKAKQPVVWVVEMQVDKKGAWKPLDECYTVESSAIGHAKENGFQWPMDAFRSAKYQRVK